MEDLYSKDIKAMIESAPKESAKPRTFEEAKDQALAEFKPKYDTSKTMYENGKDIAQTLAVNEALQDQGFLGELKEDAKENIRTDMDTDKKKSEVKNQDAFYKKHQPVLEFANMKAPCSLVLMKWVYIFAVVPFMIKMVIAEFFNLLKSIIDCTNSLFDAVFGQKEYLLDQEGKPVKDEQGRYIVKRVGVNLLTKIIFWFAFTIVALIIIFAIIKGITGFDVIQAIKSLWG